MARAPIRTVTLTRDGVVRILELFGTVVNAYRMLVADMSVDLTYAQFYRAMQFETVTPAHRTIIEEAWERWCYLFLRPEVPVSCDFALDSVNVYDLPLWHPDSEAEEVEG